MSERAAVYLRVSSDGQADDGTSLETQEQQCREYCARKGYEVVDVIPEIASGVESMGWRPELAKARQYLQQGRANILLCWKFDRVNRDSTDNLLLFRETEEAHAHLESVQEGRIPAGMQGRMQLFMYGESGRMERDAIVLRTQTARRQRVADGMPLVGKYPLYGYRYTYGPGKRIGTQRKTGYAIEDETAAVVRFMYEQTAAGMSLHQLARTLNAQGTPTPTQWLEQRGMLKAGAKVTPAWSRQMLHQLLSNPSYAGKHVAYRRQQVKLTPKQDGQEPRRTMRLRADGDSARVELSIPPIVSVELWERAQTAMHARKLDSPRRNREPEATLLRAGFAICGHCGSKMLSDSHHDPRRPQPAYRVYRCSRYYSRVDDTREPCPGGGYAIKASLVDADVWRMVSEIARDTPHLQRLLDSRRAKMTEAWEMAQTEQERVAAEIAQYEQQKTTLARRMATETDDGVYSVLRQEMQNVTAILTQLQKRSAATATRVTSISAIRQRIDDILTGKTGASLAQFAHQTLDVLQSVQAQNVLDTLSYQEKRELLSVLGVQVKMYASDSDYARSHNGKRWEFAFNPDSAMMRVRNMTECGTPFTWQDWLAVA